MEMGLNDEDGEGGGRKGRAGGQKGRAKGVRGRAKGEIGGIGGKGGKFEIVINFAPPPSMRVWCDPQMGDEGKVLAINMRRIF